MLRTNFFLLLRLEYLSERRKRFTLPSILLYLGCIFFIVYQVDRQHALGMNAIMSLYWVVQLFLSVWITFESMQLEHIKRMLFWYQLIPIHLLFVVKSVYNMVVLCCFSNLLWLLCGYLFLPSEAVQWHFFFLLSFVSMAFASIFSFMAYMVCSIQKQLGLVGILGIPLIIPMLMITMTLLNKMMITDDISLSYMMQYVPFYIALIVLVMFSGVYLVPYLKPS